MKNPLKYTALLCVLLSFAACRKLAESLTKEVEIDLPLYPNTLVVESYLIPGQPYALSLSETISTEEGFKLNFVKNATVTVAYGSTVDTLKPFTLTTQNQALTAYIAPKLVPADYTSVFRLEIKTADGRTCSASTQIMPPVTIDSIAPFYNTENKATLLSGLKDKAATRDFYRYTVFQQIKGRDTIRSAQRRSDQNVNGQSIFFTTAFRFKENDTLKTNLYHITPEYYQFLESSSAAQNANGNPFSSPAGLVSNIVGGIGIFTGTSVTKKTVVIPKR
jgi:Domain of unknown function (DUF4249)